jgi:replication initiation protein RepC
VASKGWRAAENGGARHPGPPERPRGPQEGPSARPDRTDSGTVMRLSTDELVRLASKLRPYLRAPVSTWLDIVEAADWLRHDLGVSKPLWGEACITMGREEAAVALAIVSAKPGSHRLWLAHRRPTRG